jgi:acyl carrier protein
MDFEARLAAIRGDVAEVLAMELDQTYDAVPLTQLGIDSLTMLEIAARLRDLHGLAVTSSTFLEARTIRDLADQVAAADRGQR